MAGETEVALRAGRPTAHLLETVAWWALCVAVVAPALVVDSVPFAGFDGIFAAGGRYALRIAALGLPLAVSALAWAVAALLGRVRLRHTPFHWGLAALVVLAGLSTVLALDPRVALHGFWLDEQGLVVWLLYALVALLGSQLVVSRARMEQLSFGVAGVGAVVAAIALLEVAGVRMFGIPADEWMYNRGISTMMNPDFLGTYLVVPALIALGLAVATVGLRRIVAAGLGLVMLVSIAYTLTRGAWIGAVAGGVVLGVLLWAVREASTAHGSDSDEGTSSAQRAIPVAVVVAGFVLLVALLGAGPLASRVASTFENARSLNSLLSGRITIWSELVPAIAERPVLGAGPGNMVYAWQPFAGEGTLAAQGSGAIIDSAHSVPLDLAVQFGLPFAVLLIVGVIVLAARAVLAAREAATGGHVAAARLVVVWVAAGAGIGVALLSGVTIVPILSLIAVLLGVQLAVVARPAKGPLGVSGTAFVALVAVTAVALGTWSALTGYSAVAGNQATRNLPERARRDLVALQIAPWRQGPAMDLVRVTQQLSDGEQSAVGATEGRAHQMLLDRDGLNALTLYGAGDYQLMVAGNPERALALAERSLELRPVFVPGVMLKGDALIALGETERGLEYLGRAVELESLAVIEHGWETPWDSYLQALVREATDNPAAAETARVVYARFAERFPNSMLLRSFGEQVTALGP